VAPRRSVRTCRPDDPSNGPSQVCDRAPGVGGIRPTLPSTTHRVHPPPPSRGLLYRQPENRSYSTRTLPVRYLPGRGIRDARRISRQLQGKYVGTSPPRLRYYYRLSIRSMPDHVPKLYGHHRPGMARAPANIIRTR